MNKRRCHRAGFTLIELFVVIRIIGILLGLFLPSHRGTREVARRMSCSNNFKQIGLGLHNYHSVHKHLPAAMWGEGDISMPLTSNASRLSGVVTLLPFLEQQAMWETISEPSNFGGTQFPAMGPAPWIKSYEPWSTEIHVLRCPSSPVDKPEYGETNYAFNVGDKLKDIHTSQEQRGFFRCGGSTKFQDVVDGLSNSAMMCEITNQIDRDVRGSIARNQPKSLLDVPWICKDAVDSEEPFRFAESVELGRYGRGARWADGAAPFTLVNMVLPPNDPSCAVGMQDTSDGVFTAGSFHRGGCHVLMGDGAVLFLTDSIEAGGPGLSNMATKDSDSKVGVAPSSPYGLWGAIGTVNGAEKIAEQLNQ